jgi:hypothetical protein
MVVLAVLLAVAVAVLIRPSWLLLGVLVHLEMAWLLVNRPVEGPVLVGLSDGHGFTVADLVVPAMMPILALSVVRLLRHVEKAAGEIPSSR